MNLRFAQVDPWASKVRRRRIPLIAPFTVSRSTRNLYRPLPPYGVRPRAPVEQALGGSVQKARSTPTGAFPFSGHSWGRFRRAGGKRLSSPTKDYSALPRHSRLMSPLWGPSRRDQVHLLSALESLGSTSIAGLSAALSWPTRKTERTLRDVVASGAAPLRFDAGRQMVEWITPVPRSPSSPAEPLRAEVGPRPAATSLAFARTVQALEAQIKPRRSVTLSTVSGSSGVSRCPACHSTLESTGDGAHGYCTKCGRLIKLSAAVQPIPGLDAATHRSVTAPVRSGNGADRKSQELFAAWVSQRPIPCPRCRTTMNHHGVSEYSCPACGEQVKFPKPELGAPAPATEGPPSVPTKPN